MFSLRKSLSVGFAVCAGMAADPTEARLAYSAHLTDGGIRFVIVRGSFEFSDNLADFRAIVIREQPAAIGFDSPGGNVAKAMELGRIIRALGLSTFQVRDAECASACSLAFLGGVSRAAQPGSIGVHKSSFSDTSGIPTHDAVSAVQQLTAEVIGYMMEMGTDPALLQLSLSYDSDDIRYLSGSEMAKYKVTTGASAQTLSIDVPAESAERRASSSNSQQANTLQSLEIPLASSGSILHPRGSAPIKLAEDAAAKSVASAPNGTAVKILATSRDWYRVSTAGHIGYMHSSWIRVDQFEERSGDRRFVQVKSFSSLPEAEAFVKQSSVPLVVHLAANGWLAVTLKDIYAAQEAKDVLNALKSNGLIAEDSMVTLGNTYVRRVCCE
ncbi:hypothetical protein BLJAPNOD_04676 [Ensifer sp. M14]|uniref:SH3 domain-containing protein n=1 Tax=Ensifer sp. M14 TaxID=2203782 RepID=UPI000E2B0F8B|nr:SH3 domain-containing protein [Ensifer sp. M14]RDL48401.1 hypothetical protein BLJAPNOD_04676 [Ensifer sp. M14]